MKIRITLTRETEYEALVDMDEATFTRLNAALDSSDMVERKAAENEINSLVKPDDWQDDSLKHLWEFYVEKPQL